MNLTSLSGPIFEGKINGPWSSVHQSSGGHYNNYGCLSENGMRALREFFSDGVGDAMNLCLFSTSGVHGSYQTIEDAEKEWLRGCKRADKGGSPAVPEVTFLVVQPRLCTVRHGNCRPASADDFAFLKKLRQTSWDALLTIGRG